MKRYTIPLIVLVLLGGFSVWWYSPTQVIKRKVSSLLSTLTLEASEGRAGRNFRGYALHDLLDEVGGSGGHECHPEGMARSP